MDWSEKILEQSKKTLIRFHKILSEYELTEDKANIIQDKNMKDFLNALYDDLNTPKALAVINGWFDKLKKKNLPENLAIQLIKKAIDILGLNLKEEKESDNKFDENKKIEIEKMIEDREIARQNKNFKKADEIRDKLKKMNVLIDDTSKGAKWSIND